MAKTGIYYLLLFWSFLLGMGGIIVFTFILVRELRKLIRQTRKMLIVYFPESINQEAQKEDAVQTGTYVKFERMWDEERERTD